MKINVQMHYLWRAVNHEGEVLESFASKIRDKPTPLKFMKKLMKRHAAPRPSRPTVCGPTRPR